MQPLCVYPHVRACVYCLSCFKCIFKGLQLYSPKLSQLNNVSYFMVFCQWRRGQPRSLEMPTYNLCSSEHSGLAYVNHHSHSRAWMCFYRFLRSQLFDTITESSLMTHYFGYCQFSLICLGYLCSLILDCLLKWNMREELPKPSKGTAIPDRDSVLVKFSDSCPESSRLHWGCILLLPWVLAQSPGYPLPFLRCYHTLKLEKFTEEKKKKH